MGRKLHPLFSFWLSQVPGITRIDANDMDRAAGESMRRNVEYNGAAAAQRINVLCHDVRHVMLHAPKVCTCACTVGCPAFEHARFVLEVFHLHLSKC